MKRGSMKLCSLKRLAIIIFGLVLLIALASCSNESSEDVVHIAFDSAPGAYSAPFGLKVNCSNPSLEIRYTLDCEIPTAESELYTEEGIDIRYRGGGGSDPASVNVVRCAAFDKDGNMCSEVLTGTYILSDSPSIRYSTLVISLVGEPDELYGHERGILVAGKVREDFLTYGKPSYWTNTTLKDANYFRTGIEWERELNLEVFGQDGSLILSQGVGARVSGGWSRDYNHKSIRLFARYIYDDKNEMAFDAYPGLLSTSGLPVVAHSTILLRTGSSNTDNTIIQTPALMQLAEDAGLDTMHYRPVCVYLNGKYYGFMAMIEDLSTGYFESHFNIPAEEITCINGTHFISGGGAWTLDNGPQSEFDELMRAIDFVIDSDMTNAENYKRASEMFDIDNIVRYFCFEAYIGNNDWPGNNVRVWRRITDGYNPDAEVFGYDGRWRFAIKDLDMTAGFSLDSVNYSVFYRLTKEEPRLRLDLLFQSLYKNEEFRDRVIACFSDYMSTIFLPETAMEAFGEAILSSQYEMRIYLPSFGVGGGSLSKWYSQMRKPRDFFVTRLKNTQKELKDLMKADWYDLNVEVEGEGTLNVSTLEVTDKLTVKYLDGLNILVDTAPQSGWRLASLTLDGKPIDGEAFKMPSKTATLKAVFEKDESYSPKRGLRINEVKYEHARTDTACDVVELYNNSDSAIYLKGYSIQKDGLRADGTEDTDRWTFPSISIGAGEYITVSFDKDGTDNSRLRASFGLGAGDTLALLDRNGDAVDVVELPVCNNHVVFAQDDDGWYFEPYSTFGEANIKAEGYELGSMLDERTKGVFIHDGNLYADAATKTDDGYIINESMIKKVFGASSFNNNKKAFEDYRKGDGYDLDLVLNKLGYVRYYVSAADSNLIMKK